MGLDLVSGCVEDRKRRQHSSSLGSIQPHYSSSFILTFAPEEYSRLFYPTLGARLFKYFVPAGCRGVTLLSSSL